MADALTEYCKRLVVNDGVKLERYPQSEKGEQACNESDQEDGLQTQAECRKHADAMPNNLYACGGPRCNKTGITRKERVKHINCDQAEDCDPQQGRVAEIGDQDKRWHKHRKEVRVSHDKIKKKILYFFYDYVIFLSLLCEKVPYTVPISYRRI